MADLEKRGGKLGEESSSEVVYDTSEIRKDLGWKYKEILGIKGFWYASPPAQLLIVAFVCFLCPGMFNALGGIGGGGQINAKAVDEGNTGLYGTFAIVAFFAGSFANRVGIKWALTFGGMGYSLYIASFLSYNFNQNADFVIFAGVMLGLCAGLLWTAQGAIMMSYPREASKGKYISWFWIIFNLGAVLGSLIPLGQNIDDTTAATVSNGTYIGFLVLTFLGALLACCLTDAKNVLRADGSRVIVMKNPSWRSELLGMWETLRDQPRVVLLFPMFWSSNFFYTYQFNEVNLPNFDTRTRSLNGLIYWAMQMIGALTFGYCLDIKSIKRSTRARAAWGALLVLTFAIWGGGYAFQKTYTRAHPITPILDWTSDGFGGPFVLYMFYGFFDASWQTCVYWFMGALTNNGRDLANYAGFYKGIQSAGACVAFAIDYGQINYMHYFTACWVLLAASLIIASPLLLLRIKDTVPIEEDLKHSDEQAFEVAAGTGAKAMMDEKRYPPGYET